MFAVALELPTETFVNFHKYEEKDEAWFRCENLEPSGHSEYDAYGQTWLITMSITLRTKRRWEVSG